MPRGGITETQTHRKWRRKFSLYQIHTCYPQIQNRNDTSEIGTVKTMVISTYIYYIRINVMQHCVFQFKQWVALVKLLISDFWVLIERESIDTGARLFVFSVNSLKCLVTLATCFSKELILIKNPRSQAYETPWIF